MRGYDTFTENDLLIMIYRPYSYLPYLYLHAMIKHHQLQGRKLSWQKTNTRAGVWHVKKDCLIWKYFKVWHFLMHNKQVEVSPEYQCQHFPLISALFFLYFESFSEYCEHKIDLSVWRKSIDLFADKSSWKCLPKLALEMEFRVCFQQSVNSCS